MPRLRHIFHPGYDFGRGLPFVKMVHGFVLNKPSQIRDHLLTTDSVAAEHFEMPRAMEEDALSAIHSDEVLRGLQSAKRVASAGEIAALAYLPTSVVRHLFVKPQVLACGGTEAALAHAATGDWVFHLSGGFHHARPHLSHGFCLVNDVAWAVHSLRERGVHKRILVLDFDLHQGDGTAVFFQNDADVFTASLHQEDTFPQPKALSDLDVGLHGLVRDDAYIDAVDAMLVEISNRFHPEVIVYVAGTDPYHADRIGTFHVSSRGLCARDVRVARYARSLGAGLVALPAGGYSADSPILSANGFIAMAEIFEEP